MFIVYGWLKEKSHVKTLLTTYCYNCNYDSSWELWCETEWATFFAIKTIPFLKKFSIACRGCNDAFDLNKSLSKRIVRLTHLNKEKSDQLHDELVVCLEKHQMSNKTERQIEYIKSIRAYINKDKNA
jgi:hypothetical protein